MKTYYCAKCEKEVPASEIRFAGGGFHKECGSGRVTPVEEKKA